ncbi:MAG TPA: hypothetical protein VIZ31_08875 [Vicinamibacteria bacterium]
MIDRTRPALVSAAVAALALTGCAATTFQSTWKAPDAGPLGFAGQKVVAMVVVPDVATRRGAEDQLAAYLRQRGVEGLPASAVVPENEIKDKEKVKDRFVKAEVAGVVVMHVLGKDQELTATGPTYMGPTYGGFYGGWYGWGWGMPAYSPGYIRTDTQLYIETLVYSLKQDKLVWAARSKSTNPDRVDTLIKELMNASIKEMQKVGLVKKG